MRPRMVPSVRSRAQSAMGAAGRCNRPAHTKLVQEGGQLSHPQLNGLGEVTLLPVKKHGLVTADVWDRYPRFAFRPEHLQWSASGAAREYKARGEETTSFAGGGAQRTKPALDTRYVSNCCWCFVVLCLAVSRRVVYFIRPRRERVKSSRRVSRHVQEGERQGGWERRPANPDCPVRLGAKRLHAEHHTRALTADGLPQ